MPFTNYVPPLLSNEQAGVMPDLIGKLLGGYKHAVQSKYLPQQIEADIFSKRFSPLAALATTPMFLQNPQFQSALGDLISKNLHFGGSSFNGNASQNNPSINLPTYADQVKKDVNEASNLSKDLSKKGKINIGSSSLAGQAESYLGDIGKHLVDFFTNGKITSELAQKQNRFEDILSTLKNNAVQSGRLSARDAEELFSRKPNETAESQLSRIKKELPGLFDQENTSSSTPEDQQEKDNKEISFAIGLAEQIYQRTGKIVGENVIFDYMQKHPGPINISKLLKETGAK